MEDYDIDERKVSKINAAGLMNLTIKRLWDNFYEHFRAVKYNECNRDLDCLWVELGGDEEDNSEAAKNYASIDMEVAANYCKIPERKGFATVKNEHIPIMAKQYRLLMKKAIFLRRLQNKQGKGTAYLDDSDSYMDG